MSDTNSPRLHSSATSSADLDVRAPGAFATMSHVARRTVVLVPVVLGASGCFTTQGTTQGAAGGVVGTGFSVARTGADLALTPPTVVKDAAVGVGLGISEEARKETKDTLTKSSVVVEESGAFIWRSGVRIFTAPIIGAIDALWGSANTSVDDASKTLDKVTSTVTSSGSNIRSGK